MRLRASCRLLASYFCKGAHRTGSRCSVEGTHRPGSRCRYTGAHRPGSRSRCVPIGARGSRHTSAFGSRRLLTGAHRPESSYTGAHRPGLRRTGARRPGSSCVLTGAHRPGSSCTGTCRCLQAQLQMHGCQQAASQLQGRPGPKSGVSSRPKNLPYCSHACLDSTSSVRWSWVKQHACSHCFTASAEAKRRSGYLSGSRVLFTLCVHCQKIDACVPQVAVV